MALVASGKPGYRPLIDRAQAFLTKFQVDEEEGYSKADKFYGGVGYGADLRPDLANLQFALQALKASGLAADHAAWGKAITFLERTQNRSESNDQAWAGNDGGFVYGPAESKAVRTSFAVLFIIPSSIPRAQNGQGTEAPRLWVTTLTSRDVGAVFRV